MKRTLFALLAFLFTLSASFSQILDPIDWSFSVEQNGDEATLITKATIDEGWHLYAQKLESDEGPIATEFTFTPYKGYTLVGENIETSKPHVEYDKNFDMNLSFFEGEIIFKQKIKITSGSDFIVKGSIYFMVCDDEKCLPPTDEFFEFNVKGVKGGVKLNPVSSPDETSTPQEGNTFEIAPESNIGEPNAQTGILDPVEWTFSSTKVGENQYEVVAKAVLDEGWHIFSSVLESNMGPNATEFNFTDTTLKGEIVEVGEVHEEYDKGFEMNVRIYEGEVLFKRTITVTNPETIIEGEMYYQVCIDDKCIFPDPELFKIDLKTGKVIKEIDNSSETGTEGILPHLEKFDLNNPVNDCGGESSKDSKKSMWIIFLLGLGGGLFAILTPCVYPMIPLTVSFFTKGGQDKGKGLGKAGLYGLFILLIYVSLSIPFHVSDLDPEVLNGIATNPILNIVFFVVFVFFAFSFLGFYELTLPSKWSNKSDSASNRGGFIGIFFMALTLALVSFSCTGPILGSVLAGVLKDGAWPLTVALLGFGLALGLPFAVFAAFPSLMKSIPQSGGWLNSVKVVLGFLELGLALKFLSNADLVMQWGLLKREVFFGIWILLGVGLAAYLFGLIKFPHDSKGKKKLSFFRTSFAVLMVAFVIYLIPGLTCGDSANRRLISGFPPPMHYSFCAGDEAEIAEEEDGHLKFYKDFEEARQEAIAQNKPMLIDFTGWACVSCREVEENIWPDSVVHKLIKEEYILTSLYVDDRTKLPKEEQGVVEVKYDNGTVKKKKIRTVGDKWSTFETIAFKNNSQPRYALLSSDGVLLNNPISYKDIKENDGAVFYAEFLECGLEAFEQIKTN